MPILPPVHPLGGGQIELEATLLLTINVKHCTSNGGIAAIENLGKEFIKLAKTESIYIGHRHLFLLKKYT